MTKILDDKIIDHLALAYDKPREYVIKCVKFHNVDLPLPRYRTAEDGLSDFYSDMTAMFFDPSVQDGVDSAGKPNFPAKSKTLQEFTEELDLNVIMARFIASDFDPSTLPVSTKKALQGDFSDAPASYHEALNMVVDAKRAFMTLPADLRARFENDPQQFLDFCADPANMEELVSLGLAETSKEDLSTTISRSFKDLGEMVVGKSGQTPVVPQPPSTKVPTRTEG